MKSRVRSRFAGSRFALALVAGLFVVAGAEVLRGSSHFT